MAKWIQPSGRYELVNTDNIVSIVAYSFKNEIQLVALMAPYNEYNKVILSPNYGDQLFDYVRTFLNSGHDGVLQLDHMVSILNRKHD